jgi:SAM-dependent methyltransferase
MSNSESTDWYQKWFDEDYLALYVHRDDTEARRFVNAIWESLELGPGAPVADVPCGAGRHCLAFADHGARVVGVDLSLVMLGRAGETFLEHKNPAQLVRGDLRNLPLASGFEVVANVFSSIGYFDDEADNRRSFAELARLLAPEGILIVDVINPAFLRANFVPESWRETPRGDIMEWRELDAERGRVTKRVQIRHGSAVRMIHESVRLYDQSELLELAGSENLTPMDFWGDYDGGEFTSHSPRLIMFARR